jgi:polar amino acid transport system substrate-binding protein
MKKLLTILATLVLTISCVFGLTACGPKAKLDVKNIELTAETYAFAVNKSNTALKDSVNAIMAELEETGELEEIINSFFTGDATFEYTNPAAPDASNKANYLVVGTNAYFPPFEMYNGAKLTGVDMQLASIIATELGKTLYINDMDFDALIPSVMNGDIDLAMAGMTVNAERMQQVDFTVGYYESAQVLTVLEDDTTFDACETAADVEAILAQQGKDFVIGTQQGTTGYMYSAGDAGFGYDGFTNLSTKAFTTGALAMKDLQNGKLNAVILDKQPSLMITASMNK